jgi:hypothetical protein
MEHRLPIGCAPNVHVSLVLLPEECASLSTRRFRWQRARLAALRLAFGLAFRRRLARLDARRRSAAAGGAAGAPAGPPGWEAAASAAAPAMAPLTGSSPPRRG